MCSVLQSSTSHSVAYVVMSISLHLSEARLRFSSVEAPPAVAPQPWQCGWCSTPATAEGDVARSLI